MVKGTYCASIPIFFNAIRSVDAARGILLLTSPRKIQIYGGELWSFGKLLGGKKDFHPAEVITAINLSAKRWASGSGARKRINCCGASGFSIENRVVSWSLVRVRSSVLFSTSDSLSFVFARSS